MKSTFLAETDDATILLFVLFFPDACVFVNQVRIYANDSPEQINAHVAVWHLVLSELGNCNVVHAKLMLFEERNSALIEGQLGYDWQLFPVENLLLRRLDTLFQFCYSASNLVLVHEDRFHCCLTLA